MSRLGHILRALRHRPKKTAADRRAGWETTGAWAMLVLALGMLGARLPAFGGGEFAVLSAIALGGLAFLGLAAKRPATALALLPLVFLLAATKFRGRPPDRAVSGVADLQVVAEVGLYAVAGLVVLLCWRHWRAAVPPWGPEAWLGAFGVFALASATWSIAPTLSAIRGAQFLILLAYAVVAVESLGPRGAMRALFGCVLGYLAVGAAAALVVPGAEGYMSGITPPRFSWVVIHPNLVSFLALAAAIFVLDRVFGAEGPPGLRRGLMLGAVLLALIALALATRSRLPLMAFTGVFVVMFAFQMWRSRWSRLFYALLIVGCAVAFGVLVVGITYGPVTPDNLQASWSEKLFKVVWNALSRGQSVDMILNFNNRVPVWEFARDIVSEHPIIGVGYAAASGPLLAATRDWKLFVVGQAHSAVFESLISLGLVGTVLLFVAILSAWWRAVRAVFAAGPGRRGTVLRLPLALLTFALVHGLGQSSFGKGPGFEMLVLLVTLSAAMALWRRSPEVQAAGSLREGVRSGPAFRLVGSGSFPLLLWVGVLVVIPWMLAAEKPVGGNLQPRSEALEVAPPWVWARVRVEADTMATPNGTRTADKIVETTVANTHYIRTDFPDLLDGEIYTTSFHVRRGERTRTYIVVKSKSGRSAWVVFDLRTGEIQRRDDAVLDAGIAALPGGWYRVHATIDVGTGEWVPFFGVGMLSDDGEITYAGDGKSGLYVWGAQLERGSLGRYESTMPSGLYDRLKSVSNWLRSVLDPRLYRGGAILAALFALGCLGFVARRLLRPGTTGAEILAVLSPVALMIALPTDRPLAESATFATLGPQQYLHLATIALTGGYVLLRLLRDGRSLPWTETTVFAPVAAYAVWAALTILVSPNWIISSVKVVQLGAIVGVFALVLAGGAGRDRGRVKELLVVSVVLLLAIAWVAAALFPDVAARFLSDRRSSAGFLIGGLPFNNSTIGIAAAVLFAMGIAHLLLPTDRAPYSRAAWWWLTGFAALSILTAMSRVPFVLSGLVLVLALAAARRYRLLAGLAVLVLAFLAIGGEAVVSHITRGQEIRLLLNLNNRLEAWGYGLALFADSPLLGQGYYSGIREQLPALLGQAAKGGWVGYQAHSDLINALANTGIVGAALLFGFMLYHGARAARRALGILSGRIADRCAADTIAAASILGLILVSGVFHSIVGWDATYGFAYVLLAVLIVHALPPAERVAPGGAG